MKPFSSLTCYRRHRKSTQLLLLLVALMTLGVSVMVRLPNSFLEHMAYSESIVTLVSLVSAIEPALTAEITAQIRAHPGPADVTQERGLAISLPPRWPSSATPFSFSAKEFGILYAMGLPRRKLVWRTLGESANAVGIAWLLGAGLCLIGLLGMQTWLYAPKGFSVNVLNPIPWLFTLPLPVASIAVGTILIARTLRKMDPVAVIENR